MVNMNSSVQGFTHPGYYSRVIPAPTLTIVSPSMDISTAGSPKSGNGIAAFLLGSALVIGLTVGVLALVPKG